MFGKLLALFIGVPLAETLILIKLGELMGFWSTVLLVIVTGILGAALARLQGFRVWERIQGELQGGRLPASELLDGLLVLAAGLVLLTPGLLTDILGFLLLIPATRSLFKAWLRKKLERALRSGKAQTVFFID